MKYTALALTAVALTFASPALAGGAAKYEITIEGKWTKEMHPVDYPANAHFSPTLGVSHNNGYRMFKAGDPATKGIQRVAEMGKLDPLDSEVAAAKQAGTVDAIFTTGPLNTMPGALTATLEVKDSHPFVSLVTMIAPSPDWFTGAANVQLHDGHRWVDTLAVTIYGWDAGTNSGGTFTMKGAENSPHEPIRLLTTPHFQRNGEVVPVGTVTFKRIPEMRMQSSSIQ